MFDTEAGGGRRRTIAGSLALMICGGDAGKVVGRLEIGASGWGCGGKTVLTMTGGVPTGVPGGVFPSWFGLAYQLRIVFRIGSRQ